MLGSRSGDCSPRYLRMTLKKPALARGAGPWRCVGAGEEAAGNAWLAALSLLASSRVLGTVVDLLVTPLRFSFQANFFSFLFFWYVTPGIA